MDNTVFAPIADKKHFKNHEASIRDYAAYAVVHKAIETSIEWAKKGGKFPHGLPGPVTSLLAADVQTATPRSRSSARVPKPTKPTRLAAPRIKEDGLEKICIIGAGAAGLYAAMICDSLHIDYDILEANSRIGGRLFTHRFNGNEGLNAEIGTPARYDYFDVGAMRFPKIPFMDRLWDLFDDIQIEGLLVDYRLSAPNTLQYFNTRPPLNSTVAPVADEDDYFHVSVQNAGAVPNHFFEAVDKPPVEHWTGLVYDYYKNMFAGLDDDNLSDDERHLVFAEAWAELTSEDHHTTRSAMRAGLHGTPSYPNTVINWLETFDSATGLYDRAFVESVMVSFKYLLYFLYDTHTASPNRTLLISGGHGPKWT
jgi:hypothetical protein